MSLLTALRRTWAEEDAGGPVDDDGFDHTFAEWARDEPRTFLLVERDGVAVGMVNVLEYRRMPSPGRAASGWGYLANAYVLPADRGSGAGTVLLRAALVHCAERGHARVVLSPSPRSVPYYARAGFTPASGLMLLDAGALARGAQPWTALNASTMPRP